MTTTTRTRASRLPAARRTAIFDATVASLVEAGYDATSIEAIAAATGTSKATIYRHWGDKPTLVVTSVAARSGVEIDVIDTGSLTGDLDELLDQCARNAAQNIDIALALERAARSDPRLRAAAHQVTRSMLSALRSVAERAVARGEIEPGFAAYLPHLLVGALFTPVFVEGSAGPVTRDYLGDFFATMVRPFIRATPG